MEQPKENIGFLVISDHKLAESFPLGQLTRPSFLCKFPRYCNYWDRGQIIFLKRGIPTKLFLDEAKPVEGILVEIS